jgi:hypothetical protein
MSNRLTEVEKGLITAELWEAGVAIMEQSLMRRRSTNSASAVQAELQDWLYRRGEDSCGDVAGPIRIHQERCGRGLKIDTAHL